MTICPVPPTAYDHVGIRVTDRARALRFYERLGFRETDAFPEARANEMETAAGLRINLIFNAAARPDAHNVLQDAAVKLPGITHLALVVDDLQRFEQWCCDEAIPVTEGPLRIGRRRITLFIRDPDGNVIELNQLCAEETCRETL